MLFSSPEGTAADYSMYGPPDLFILTYVNDMQQTNNTRFSLWEVYLVQLLSPPTISYLAPAANYPAEFRRERMSVALVVLVGMCLDIYIRLHPRPKTIVSGYSNILSVSFFPAGHKKLCCLLHLRVNRKSENRFMALSEWTKTVFTTRRLDTHWFFLSCRDP